MKYKIMVVDDSRVIYAEMEKMLRDTDIEIVKFCRSGEEAIAAYESVRPDLVTMDIIMPGIDGLEACEELLRRWPDARVLMVSSLGYDDTMGHAADIGARGFLIKPFEKESLTDAIHAALSDRNSNPQKLEA